MTIHIDTRQRASDDGQGWDSIFGAHSDQSPTDLISAVSGTLHGVDWTIEATMGNHPAYRLTVADIHLATLSTPLAARRLRDEYISDLIAQGLVGTPSMEAA